MKDTRFLCKKNAFTVSIYIDSCRKVNFKEYRKEDVEAAIANSLYSAMVFDDKRPIGTACIAGDSCITFFTKDVVADPVYQKNRTENLPIQKLQEYFAGVAYEGAYIGFVSTPNCAPSYKEHGFLERPCDGMGPGMVKLYDSCEVKK